MVLLDKLPTDSVLRRHTLTERQRVLGLPPTDSVLKRHHAQLLEAMGFGAATPPTPAAAAPTVTTAATPPAPKAAAPAAVRAPASPAVTTPAAATASSGAEGGGGMWGWLRRLLGGT